MARRKAYHKGIDIEDGHISGCFELHHQVFVQA